MNVNDYGQPVSYEVLARGTPVYSSDGYEVGTVNHVLADESADVFDGIVIAEPHHGRRHRFADADEVDRIYERAVVLKLDRDAAERLPEPSPNPAVMRDDPAETRSEALADKLKRAWDYLSGRY
jgi:uncharacterized protein YrrD